MPPRIALVPLGVVTEEELAAAAEGLQGEIFAEIERAAPMAVPAAALGRRPPQARAEVLLFALRRARPPGGLVLGICDRDLYAAGLDFVFGLASRRVRTAVVSVARLRDAADPTRARRRIATEAAHEAGHLVGLSHCAVPGCAMQYSSSLAQADAKGPGLCDRCLREARQG